MMPRQAAVNGLREAVHRGATGNFVLSHHGIPRPLIAACFADARRMFDQQLESDVPSLCRDAVAAGVVAAPSPPAHAQSPPPAEGESPGVEAEETGWLLLLWAGA